MVTGFLVSGIEKTLNDALDNIEAANRQLGETMTENSSLTLATIAQAQALTVIADQLSRIANIMADEFDIRSRM